MVLLIEVFIITMHIYVYVFMIEKIIDIAIDASNTG